MSRGMWEAVETSTGEVRMGEAKGRRGKGRGWEKEMLFVLDCLFREVIKKDKLFSHIKAANVTGLHMKARKEKAELNSKEIILLSKIFLL